MRRAFAAAIVTGFAILMARGALGEDRKSGGDHQARIEVRDDCDSTDPGWTPTGGCVLKGGAVNLAEFNLYLFSPLSAGSPVGHPAWRMDPTYVRLDADGTLRVTNTGGRRHTFTEVASFGGGVVPPLNGTLLPAPECAASAPLPPGTKTEVRGLAAGDHAFQCCIHPWMRILVKVEPEEEHGPHH
ncbi:MAG: hypothetical protein ABI682_05940 [Acidobacteriota bacterium]